MRPCRRNDQRAPYRCDALRHAAHAKTATRFPSDRQTDAIVFHREDDGVAAGVEADPNGGAVGVGERVVKGLLRDAVDMPAHLARNGPFFARVDNGHDRLTNPRRRRECLQRFMQLHRVDRFRMEVARHQTKAVHRAGELRDGDLRVAVMLQPESRDVDVLDHAVVKVARDGGALLILRLDHPLRPFAHVAKVTGALAGDRGDGDRYDAEDEYCNGSGAEPDGSVFRIQYNPIAMVV